MTKTFFKPSMHAAGTALHYFRFQDTGTFTLVAAFFNRVLRESLKKTLDRIGMVYLGCHGFVKYEENLKNLRIAMGNVDEQKEQLTCFDIERMARLSEILREFRAVASAQLVADENSIEKQKLFNAAFDYVYYGHPLLRIRLLPAEDENERDRQD